MRHISAFFVLCVLFSQPLFAGWATEVPIQQWCYDAQVLKDFMKAHQDGNTEVADQIASKAFQNGVCISTPRQIGGAFRPNGIESDYPDYTGGPAMIIKGNLIQEDESLGREVFLQIPTVMLEHFKDDEGGKESSAPSLHNPEGWQDT